MYKSLAFLLMFLVSACSFNDMAFDANDFNSENEQNVATKPSDGDVITQKNVFVVEEGEDFVTYQYKEVRVDEISPLAILYCADVADGKKAYLRNVSMFHNGYMRATFDCVNLAM